MKLSEQTVKVLTQDGGFYDCSLVKKKFAYHVFEEEIQPLGNIVNFIAPTKIGPLTIDKCCVIAYEIPNIDIFAGVCFQRLYAAQLGTILTQHTGQEIYVYDGHLLVENKQCSIVVNNKVKDVILTHILLPLEMKENEQQLFVLNFEEEKIQQFLDEVTASFHSILRSIFIETQRDNL